MIKKLALIEIGKLVEAQAIFKGLQDKFRPYLGSEYEDSQFGNDILEPYIIKTNEAVSSARNEIYSKLQEYLLDFEKQYGLEKNGFHLEDDNVFMWPEEVIVSHEDVSKDDPRVAHLQLADDVEKVRIPSFTKVEADRAERNVQKLLYSITVDEVKTLVENLE